MARQPTEWHNSPAAFPAGIKHRLLRCPAIRMKPMVILSDQIAIARVHWIHRRSVPCPGEAHCEACKKSHPQPKGYICVWDPNTNERAVLELTPPTFEALGAYRTLYATLRGATIALTRSGTKENGRMSAALQPSNIPATQLPQPIDVAEVMDQLWDQPDKSQRTPMPAPRDDIGGTSAIVEQMRKLQAAGLIDSDGNAIVPKPVEPPTEPLAEPPKQTNGDLPPDARQQFLDRVNKRHRHKSKEQLLCTESPPSSS